MPELTVPALFDELTAAGERRCGSCRESKPLDAFGPHKRGPLGINRTCRRCHGGAVARSRTKYADRPHGTNVDGERTCNSCRIRKPLADFPRRRGCVEGHGPSCKPCWSDKRAADRRANLPAMLIQEALRRDRNRENQNAASRRYHARRLAAEPEVYRARQRARYWADPETRRARDRAWHAANNEASLAISVRRAQNRRARVAQVVVITFTREEFDARMAFWGDRCYMCAGPWSAVEHVKPIVAGGPHMLANLRPACTSCNTSKGGRWHGPVWAMRLIDSRRPTTPRSEH